MTLAGKTLFISGGSRGIGLAIALRAARDGANVALIAKTAEPHPKLEGTVYTAAGQIGCVPPARAVHLRSEHQCGAVAGGDAFGERRRPSRSPRPPAAPARS
jgi:NAD(P)-dependent dehydrogenase (short-subunit alcohol dehydrogenase family)